MTVAVCLTCAFTFSLLCFTNNYPLFDLSKSQFLNAVAKDEGYNFFSFHFFKEGGCEKAMISSRK